MDIVSLSRWQFGITTVYHFFFVPLTLGLSVLVAIMESLYLIRKNDVYKKMAKFWGTLFIINFAMGVVTGIVQEFQFGMNWSEYSRFVGDIFGAPLAIEALLAFFLESTFLGLWIFGWERVSKGVHLAAIWLVAIAANVSAFWILSANAFMQEPVGYKVLENGKIVMSSFLDLIKNPNLWVAFPHTVFSGFTTAAFFVLGISAYHLIRKKEIDLFSRSFRISTIFAFIGILGVVGVGHNQTQQMVQSQPMKIAAAEGLWNTEDPASFSLFTLVDQKHDKDIVSIRIPYVLSFLAYDDIKGPVKGILNLQKEYEAKYGPGNYVPNIMVSYFSFRIMVLVGLFLLLVAFLALIYVLRKKPIEKMKFLWIFPILLFFPYISNSTGWILTEMGRQPWIVFGLLKTQDAISPNVTAGMVLTSLIGFTLVYGVLMVADIYLLNKYAQKGAGSETDASIEVTAKA
ncbi:MAG: cytochrome ubiquinol oxidase subunit I [Anaerolineaceae bacterium]